MSDLIVATVKIAFLALLWLFILFTANVVRTDLFGRRVPAASLPALTEQPVRPRRSKAKKQPNVLVVTQGRQTGLEVQLADVVNLGRTADSTINLDDDYASTRHAQLVKDSPETWVVTDLQSTNGTFVNGVRITVPTPVKRGDVIRIGRTQLTLDRR